MIFFARFFLSPHPIRDLRLKRNLFWERLAACGLRIKRSRIGKLFWDRLISTSLIVLPARTKAVCGLRLACQPRKVRIPRLISHN